jgi:hypothetical protein
MSADWNWSERDEAMAGRILAAPLAADPDALGPGHLADLGFDRSTERSGRPLLSALLEVVTSDVYGRLPGRAADYDSTSSENSFGS